MELGRTVHPSNEMKQIILSIYLLILFLKVEAKYAAYSIEHMVLTCDTFLIGQIVTHDAETFTIALDDSSGHVRIQKFKNWTCAHRYAEYEIGQKALFFLEKRDRKFYVMSGGNEGELPIVGDSLYLSSLSVYYPFDLDVGQELTGSKTTLISGKRFHGYDFRTRHFVETIRTFRG
ncbi:MAG: hypothetical protein MRY83_03845, partial [Flavobacteriales bacterium]|nr:hypothetical protein [Flavobacteriales bacterium]